MPQAALGFTSRDGAAIALTNARSMLPLEPILEKELLQREQMQINLLERYYIWIFKIFELLVLNITQE